MPKGGAVAHSATNSETNIGAQLSVQAVLSANKEMDGFCAGSVWDREPETSEADDFKVASSCRPPHEKTAN